MVRESKFPFAFMEPSVQVFHIILEAVSSGDD